MEQAYIGSELDVFAHAVNWKNYVRKWLAPYLHGEVLEVGAGLGAATRGLRTGGERRWLCLEPDPELLEQARASGLSGCEFRVGMLNDLPETERFDAILYIDVLEHIEDDRAELEAAARRLKPSGALCVLSPAHQWLYSPFDAQIGHFRRYSKESLKAAGPPGFRLELLQYLDVVGMFASLGNKLVLKSGHPTVKQILLWDRALVACSRVLDPLVGHALGRSIVAVWRN